MQQIVSTSTALTKKNIINRIADVPGGVSLATSNLVAGKIVEEAAPLTKPATGVRTVCKQAIVLAGSTTTAIKVASDTNMFKVGNFAGTKVLGKAYAITGIATASGIDTITVGTAIDTPVTGGFIYEMDAEAASNSSALENEPAVIMKDGFVVPSATQVILIRDAYTRADVHAGRIGSAYLATLPGVIEINY